MINALSKEILLYFFNLMKNSIEFAACTTIQLQWGMPTRWSLLTWIIIINTWWSIVISAFSFRFVSTPLDTCIVATIDLKTSSIDEWWISWFLNFNRIINFMLWNIYIWSCHTIDEIIIGISKHIIQLHSHHIFHMIFLTLFLKLLAF